MTPLLYCTSISKSFAGAQALKQVSFDLHAGQVHALVGENGAGKSTLIKIITGAHRADAGTLEVQGRLIEENDPVRSRGLGIAAIYQQPALFPELTAAENIAFGVEPAGAIRRIDWRRRRSDAHQVLDRIGAKIDPESLVSRLTMPEQQLVEIAKALAADARILIMDEPTASLAEQEVEHLMHVIRELRAQGVGVIYISHRLDELFGIADRVTVLRDGAAVATCPMSGIDRGELIRLMVGREISTIFPKRQVPLGETIIELRNLGCRDSGVAGATLSLRAGEILGLAGLVGAGRTELARILFGLTPADAGEIFLRGNRVAIDSPARAVALGIAYVPEDRRRHGVILEMPVAANVTLAVLRKIARYGWLDFRRERAVATEFVERLAIKTPSLDAPVGNLSGGNQQKVALARWLAAGPAVIILDEPTQGIDVGAKAEIHRLMGDLAARGLAIVMISSELPEVLGMSDRIAVMHAGKIAGILDRVEATQERIMSLALGHIEESDVQAGSDVQISILAATRPGLENNPVPPKLKSVGLTPRGNRRNPRRSSADIIARYKREFSVAFAYALLLATLAVAAPSFYHGDKLRAIVVASAPVLVAAIGMTLVILTRQIDISIGSQFSICGVVAGLLAKAGLQMPIVAAGTIAMGASLGAINGTLVAGLRLPSIVVTLATMVTLRESLRWSREGEFVRNLPAGFQWFGLGQSTGQWLIVGIAVALLALFAWGLRFLSGGRMIHATGSDPEAARLAGFRPRRIVFSVFVLLGALAGLAALLHAVRFVDVDPNAGLGLDLQVIAAVVVGGTAISGGRGTLFGTLAGVMLLATIGPALVFLNYEAHWEKAIQGAIILLAVATASVGRVSRLPVSQ